MRRTLKGLALGAAMIVLMGASSEGCSSPDTSAGGDNGEAAPKGKAAAPDQTIAAGALIKAFEANELAADEKFKGKRLRVNGVVSKVDTDLLDSEKYVLNIGTGAEFEILTVTCEGIPKAKLTKLSEGDKVTMTGDFKDGGDLGVNLNRCTMP
jgi:tRNA_anti-like